MNETQKKTKLTPLSDRVLLKRLEADEKATGGIILPDSAKKKQEQARVVATGPGKKDSNNNLVSMPVKENDVVLIEKYSGQEVSLNDEEFVIVRANEIIAIVENS